MLKMCLSVLGEQVRKHLASTFPFSDLKILSSLLVCYFSKTYCNNGFLTSTFGFYSSLALQFSCITVSLSEGWFLFEVGSN